MTVTPTKIKDVLIIEPEVFEDSRGWFSEYYSKKGLKEFGINLDFVQDNLSSSKVKGTFRGLHIQKNPFSQTKLVSCLRGNILDIAVDVRKNSPTYKHWVSVELSEENKRQLLVPKGFAHGYLSLTDNTLVQYKIDSHYNKEAERIINVDDPEIGVVLGTDNIILSDKDRDAPSLKDCDIDF
jgi:dTDP-4-dehydrorhamnose 3,5-epimerase